MHSNASCLLPKCGSGSTRRYSSCSNFTQVMLDFLPTQALVNSSSHFYLGQERGHFPSLSSWSQVQLEGSQGLHTSPAPFGSPCHDGHGWGSEASELGKGCWLHPSFGTLHGVLGYNETGSSGRRHLEVTAQGPLGPVSEVNAIFHIWRKTRAIALGCMSGDSNSPGQQLQRGLLVSGIGVCGP